MLQIHNSLTGKKEVFKPIKPGHVSMYMCGDTVYDFCHVGHARNKTAFDIVRRYLAFSGYQVRFVRNITDIDDKIIERANKNGETFSTLAARFADAMRTDYARIGLLPPDVEPLATEHMDGIVKITQTLIDKGYAYVASNGDVMYSVSKFPEYGKLSGRKLEDLRAGARVEVDEAKRDPLDFVLWKRAKPGEPSWPSPWGDGRPGWHIECSAMAHATLGTHFDIHGGGMDLKFPHHENEIAQSCAASGDKFANIWMHNGFLNVDNEKMSKSLGNFFTIRDVMDSGYVPHAETLRYFFASSHYRGPINYSLTQIKQADAALGRLYLALRDISPMASFTVEVGNLYAAQQGTFTKDETTGRFVAAMDDDFNTPEALAELQGLAKRINIAKTGGNQDEAAKLAAELRKLGRVLGVLKLDPNDYLRIKRCHEEVTVTDHLGLSDSMTPEVVLGDESIQRLIDVRLAARKAKNFKESDRIRDDLKSRGIILEDGPAGTTWRRG
jgi:cysteinyl-tRNA synthetase